MMISNKIPWETLASNTTTSSQEPCSMYNGSVSGYSNSVVGSYGEKVVVLSTTEAGPSDKRYGLAKPMRKYIRGDLKSD